MCCDCFSEVKEYPWDLEEPFPSYENRLFEIYKQIYEESLLMFKDMPIAMRHYPPDYGKKSGFYHLIYQNYDCTGKDIDRLPELNRMSKFTWGRSVIDFHKDSICKNLLIYENKRKSENNICIYSECLDFLVVLTKRKDYLLLKTAYPIEYDDSREGIYKEYNKYTTSLGKKLKTPMQ